MLLIDITVLSRREILSKYATYAKEQELKHGYSRVRRQLIKPLWNLFHGEANGKQFRIQLENQLRNENYYQNGAIEGIIWKASEVIRNELLDSTVEVPHVFHKDEEPKESEELDRKYQLIGQK